MKKTNKLFTIIILLMVLMLSIQTTMALIITEPQSIKNTFKPHKLPSNDLIVSKQVEHPYGEQYKIPDEMAFDFEINLGPDYAGLVLPTSQGDKQVDENGILKVSLKHGEEIYIEEIDEGTKVKVTEVQNRPGFTIKDVSVTKEGTISSNETLIVDYTNIYKPISVKLENITLTGTKILEGREWQENDTFAFTLDYQSANGEWITLGTKTITYDAENPEFNKFDFTELVKALEFNNVGIHNFRIYEVIGENEEISYDETINYFTIEATDETMDGQIEIKQINGYQNIVVTKDEETSNYSIDVTFNNKYEVEEIKDLNVDINALVKVENTGEQTLAPENFEIVVTNTTTNKETKILTDKDGKAITSLTFTKEDIGKTFEYLIKQTNDAKEGVTYSDKEYKVTITVSLNENNELVAKMLVNDQEVEEILAEFINTYNVDPPLEPPADIELNVGINKVVNNIGDVSITPEGFEFIFENTTTNKEEKVKTNEQGKANIKLKYTADDIGKTYSYKVKEVNTGIADVTYDTKEHNINVAITLSDDNKLIATAKVNNKKVDKINVTFENTYEKYIIEDLFIDIVINNKVNNTGKYSIGPENFEFILVNKDNGEQQKATTDKDGNASLQLKYTEDDIGKTYKYTLSVIEGNIKGLTYSKETYDIEVIIGLDENHDLVATIKVNGQVMGSIVTNFLNTYHVDPEAPSTPPTIDITDNTPYIRMMVISGGGLLLVILLQNTREQKYCFATATFITDLIPSLKPEKPKAKKAATSKKKKYQELSNDEIYDMIKSKRNKKATK